MRISLILYCAIFLFVILSFDGCTPFHPRQYIYVKHSATATMLLRTSPKGRRLYPVIVKGIITEAIIKEKRSTADSLQIENRRIFD
jgi:hypothetical protein